MRGIDNITFRQAGVEDFEAPDGSYDMVLALNLLHLLPDRTAALAKIHRLLKPGGIFVSSTVCLADRMWFLRPVVRGAAMDRESPVREFLAIEPGVA